MQHDFGAITEQLRGKHGLSFRAFSELLADRTGVTIDASGLQRIESGVREPRLNEALAISSVLGAPLEAMIDSDDLRFRRLAGLIEHGLDSAHNGLLDLGRSRHEVLAIVDEHDDEKMRAELNVDGFVDLAERLLEMRQDVTKALSQHRHPSKRWNQ